MTSNRNPIGQSSWIPPISPPGHYPRRAPMFATRGMVASIHPLASQVGLQMIRSGGNAVDAAIAAAAVLTVTDPWHGQVGGDAFMQIYDAASGRVHAINASGPAPAKATRQFFADLGGIPEDGILSASVPGVVGGWELASRQFGRLPLKEVLQPAADIARRGFPVHTRLERYIQREVEKYKRFETTSRVFLPGGGPPVTGTIFRQPELAETLEAIGEGGADEFYRGGLARRLAAAVEALGGLISPDDLAAYEPELLDPISITYRGYTITEQPPVSQGIVLLMMLKILEQYDLETMGPGSPGAVHLMVEAKKRAFEARQQFLGDPRFVDVPVEHYLSDDMAARWRELIDSDRARPEAPMADKKLYGIHPTDTTFLAAADGEGNAVSYIHSLYTGSGVVLGDTGVMLNSRMLGFSLEPDHPNVLAPGKRTIHTLNTYMVLEGDRLRLLGGTPGADMQVQTNLQVLTSLINFAADLVEAVDAPRWGSESGLNVTLENRFTDVVASDLRRRGHDVRFTGAWQMPGSVQTIAMLPDGVMMGVSDVRHDGGYISGE